MKLKYVGQKRSPISLHIKNDSGTMGISIKTNEIFDCTAEEGLWILSKFNENEDKPLFVETSEPSRMKMKQPTRKA